MSTCNITLRAFRIVSSKIGEDNLYEEIKNKLLNSTVNDRRMRLNQEDESSEEDILSNFEFVKNCIFATIIRIVPEVDSRKIDNAFFEQPKFNISDIKIINSQNSSQYKNHYYICINNNFLVTNLSKNISIQRVEDYLNFLVQDYCYSIEPLIVAPENIKLSDLKLLKITNDSFRTSGQISVVEDAPQHIVASIRKSIMQSIRKMFTETEDISEYELENILSAELKIEFIKPKAMPEEYYKKAYGRLLKPISDIQNVIFYDKNNNKITTNGILKTQIVHIEKTDKGWLSENGLRIEMSRFLAELK